MKNHFFRKIPRVFQNFLFDVFGQDPNYEYYETTDWDSDEPTTTRKPIVKSTVRPQSDRNINDDDDLFLLSLQAIQALHPSNNKKNYKSAGVTWEMRGVCEFLVHENPCGNW